MFQQCAVVPIDYASVAHEGGMLYLSPTTLPFLLQKGSRWVLKGGFACAVTCSFEKLRVLITVKKRRLSMRGAFLNNLEACFLTVVFMWHF